MINNGKISLEADVEAFPENYFLETRVLTSSPLYTYGYLPSSFTTTK